MEPDGTAVGDPEVGTLVAPGAPETGTPVVAGDPDVETNVPPTGVGAKVEGTLSSTKSFSGDFSPSTS
jgi:hypothetical protein